MKTILETQRLILREMAQEDYPALAEILQDERTMYAYEGSFSESETQAWLDNLICKDNKRRAKPCGAYCL